jgi:hypothetical protein
MAALLFEIWEDREDGCVEMSSVSQQHDEMRKLFNPNAVLLHTFRASSDFEAPRIYHEYMRWSPWKPEPNWTERQFTDEQAREQLAYLLVRDARTHD